MMDTTNASSHSFIAQLCNTIETIIFSSDFKTISEYQLIKLLQSERYKTLTDLDMKNTEQLFQLHFLLFHALYKIQVKLISKGQGYLNISPLCIAYDVILPEHENPQTNNKRIDVADPLADYYLNLDNLTNMSSDDIEQLIASFWSTLQSPDSHASALKILELEPPVTFSAIKQQYKRLASKHHPDKGGSTIVIQDINQAMATLSQHYKK